MQKNKKEGRDRRVGWEELQDDQGRIFACSKRKLGRGTFAEVWLGEWDENGPDEPATRVAIKQFHLNRQTLDRALDTEIKIMRTLDHPNIVRLISVIAIPASGTSNKEAIFAFEDDSIGEASADGIDDDQADEDRLWVVLEYLAGGDFRTYIRGKRLSEKWACHFLKEIANGLRYLRERNIVHRDLKPHNLLMTKDHRHLKIADFGFARILGSEALEATLCGSPLYMAPEVLRGDQYSNKADLWSVGVILYEMLCGTRPFDNVDQLQQLQHMVQSQPVRFPRSVHVSMPCRKLLAGLLRKDPRDRIDWDAFLEHSWFGTDWNAAPPLEKSTSEHSLSVTPPVPSPIPLVPRSSAIPISSPGFLQLNKIDYYAGGGGGAPTDDAAPNKNTERQSPFGTHPQSAPLFPAFSPSTAFSQPSSMFVKTAATTPHGGSDVPFCGGTGDDSSSSSTFPTHRHPTRSTSASIRRGFADLMSTSYGLLRDSFQGGGFQ